MHSNWRRKTIPPQYSCLENPVDRGASWAAVHRVAQSRTWLKLLSMHACTGEGNTSHSSILAWRVPGTEKPGGLPSMGSHTVGCDLSDLVAAAACTPMCIAALFTIAKTWKPPKCPSTDERINKMWYMYRVEYYWAIKNGIMPFAATWMNLEINI